MNSRTWRLSLRSLAWILATLLFLTTPGLGREGASGDLSVPQWSLKSLDLEVTPVPAQSKLSLSGRLVIELQQPAAQEVLLAINARTKGLVQLLDVSAEGANATFRDAPDRPETQLARLQLPAVHHQGDRVDVTFRGETVASSSQLMVSEAAALASWVELWYPVPVSNLKGAPNSAAPGATVFHLPAGWRSVSNGVLVSSKKSADGSVTERWETELPLARSFVAAPFASVEQVTRGGRVAGFYLLKNRKNAATQAGQLAGAISAMEARFGPYPFPSWNIAEVPEGVSFAASSEQGFMMVRSSMLDQPEGNVPLFAHEASHAWWGNLVRGSGDGSKMVTEALAQYGAVIAIESLEGKEAAGRFLRFSREGYNPLQCALGYFYIWREGGDKPLSKLTDDRWDHNLSDSKGHWFYHMLRQRVGDEIFFSTLRGLLIGNAGGSISLDALRQAFLAAGGDAELKDFFTQWLDRIGAPVLDVRWWSMNRGKEIEIHVDQIQEGEPFRFPLEIEVRTEGDEAFRKTLDVVGRSQVFTLPTGARPLQLTLDPDTKLLIWRPEYGPPPTHPK